MTTTTLHPALLQAIILATSFREPDMHAAQGALLMIGLQGEPFDAGMLPAKITNGDQHLAGMACASLAAQGLIECIGRVRSSSPLGNGRKVNQWILRDAKKPLARLWLSRHGYQDHVEVQTEIAV
jgi:hypothetical protein